MGYRDYDAVLKMLFAFFKILIIAVIALIIVFLKHIILFESVLVAVICGIACFKLAQLHGAFALLVAVAVFFLLFRLQYTKYGFWIIGTMMSLLWSLFFCMFGTDKIWQYTIFGL